MAEGMLDMVTAEIAALEVELSKDVRFQKLEHLRALRDLYVADDPNDIGKPANKGEQNKAMTAARELITAAPGPVPTTDVLDYLTALGFKIGGAEPRNNLSAMLSNTGWFDANGRRGWTIKDKNPSEAKPDHPRRPAWITATRRVGPPPPAPEPAAASGLDDDIPF